MSYSFLEIGRVTGAAIGTRSEYAVTVVWLEQQLLLQTKNDGMTILLYVLFNFPSHLPTSQQGFEITLRATPLTE